MKYHKRQAKIFKEDKDNFDRTEEGERNWKLGNSQEKQQTREIERQAQRGKKQ